MSNNQLAWVQLLCCAALPALVLLAAVIGRALKQIAADVAEIEELKAQNRRMRNILRMGK